MNKLNSNVVGANCIRPHYKEMTQNKGITLIALIITIIVMLVLVGVTINVALNGGLFTKADEAKEGTQKAADEEELQLEIVTAYNEKIGEVELSTLKTNLENKNWKDVTISGDKLTCTSPKGNTFTVTADGKVEEGGSQSGGNGSNPSEETTLISMYRAGENCTEENCTNEEHLHIGDYVNYNPNTDKTIYYPDGENANNIGENTGYTEAVGATELQMIEQETLNWRVLGAEGDNVLLISGAPTSEMIQFYGHVGYNNYKTILNKACSTLYSKTGIGTARSITMNDIDTYLDGSNYDKTTYDEDSKYGDTHENITSKFDYNSSTNTLTKLPEGTTTTLSLTADAYYYEIGSYITDPIKLNLLVGSNNYYAYWVASTSIYSSNSNAGWIMNLVSDNMVYNAQGMCYTDGEEYENKVCFRPVVTLSSNVTSADVSKCDTVPEESWQFPY